MLIFDSFFLLQSAHNKELRVSSESGKKDGAHKAHRKSASISSPVKKDHAIPPSITSDTIM